MYNFSDDRRRPCPLRNPMCFRESRLVPVRTPPQNGTNFRLIPCRSLMNAEAPEPCMGMLSPINRLIAAFVRRLWRFPRYSRGRRFIVDCLLPFVHAMPTRYGPTIRVRRCDFTNRAAVFGLYGDSVAIGSADCSPTTFSSISVPIPAFSV